MMKRKKDKITRIILHSRWLRRYFLPDRLCWKICPYKYLVCIIWNEETCHSTFRISTYYVSHMSVICIKSVSLSPALRPIRHFKRKIWYRLDHLWRWLWALEKYKQSNKRQNTKVKITFLSTPLYQPKISVHDLSWHYIIL